MNPLKKTFVLLSAAIALGSLEAEAAKSDSSPSEKDKVKKAEGEKQKKRVVKHRKARRRPADFDGDFGMPAGTAYDVISRDQL